MTNKQPKNFFSHIKKCFVSTMLMLAMLIPLSNISSAQQLENNAASTAAQLINKANQLINKENKTKEERDELHALIKKAEAVPSDKKNQATKDLIKKYYQENTKRFEKLMKEPSTQSVIDELEFLKDKFNYKNGRDLHNKLEAFYAKRDKFKSERLRELKEKETKEIITQEEIQELKKLQSELDAKVKAEEERIEGLKEAIQDTDTSSQEKAALNQELIKATGEKNKAKMLAGIDSCANSCSPRCYYRELRECTFCPLFRTVFNAASSVTKHALDTFTKPVISVVVIGFAIWIAMQILAFVASPEVRDLKDIAQSLITQSFIVMLVVIILQGGAMSFFNLALTPIYTTGQNIAQAIIKPSEVATAEQTGGLGQTNSSVSQETLKQINKPCGSIFGIYDDSKGEGALPKAMGDSIICTMTLIHNKVSQVKALGSASMCQAWKDKELIVPHLSYLLVGLGLWVGAMVMLLGVPFMMVDSVFQLAVAGSLLPFGIGSYAFKLTRGYSKKIWETFLNSMFSFIFVSLIALMLTVAYQTIILDNIGDLDKLLYSTDPVMGEILEKLPWYSKAFLEVCFVMILSWSVLSSANEFAGEFSSSISNTKLGSSIATMGGSFAKNFAVRAGKATAKGTVRTGAHLISGAFGGSVNLIKDGWTGARKAWVRSGGNVDEDGNYYREGRTLGIFGPKNRYTLYNSKDGNSTVKKTKVIKDGKTGSYVTKDKIKDADFTISTKSTVTADGKKIKKEQITVNTRQISDMFDKDSTVSVHYTNMLQKIKKSNDNIKDQKIAALANVVASKMIKYSEQDFTEQEYVDRDVKIDDNDNIIITQTLKDGSKTILKVSKGSAMKNGQSRLGVEYTKIDSKGRGYTLKTNGMVHKKTTFTTENGSANGKIKENSIKDTYALSARYEEFRSHYRNRTVARGFEKDGWYGYSAEEIEEAQKHVYSGAYIHEFGSYN